MVAGQKKSPVVIWCFQMVCIFFEGQQTARGVPHPPPHRYLQTPSPYIVFWPSLAMGWTQVCDPAIRVV